VSLVPVLTPVCHRDRVSLDLGVVRRLLQPMSTRGHTLSSCRSSHASEAFAPLLAGTNRCQLRWPPHTLPCGKPASRALHAPAFARFVPLAWTRQLHGSERSREGEARVLDEATRTLLVTLRAPGSPVRFVPWVWKTCGLIGPAETLLGCSLAKGCTVERVEVPSAAPESLRERRIAPPCAPGPRPRHSASEEALLGGTRAFFHPLEAPSSDEDGASSGLDPLNQGEPKPRWNDESQRPSRLLRPNQLAG
jgi:hypothetical protein